MVRCGNLVHRPTKPPNETWPVPRTAVPSWWPERMFQSLGVSSPSLLRACLEPLFLRLPSNFGAVPKNCGNGSLASLMLSKSTEANWPPYRARAEMGRSYINWLWETDCGARLSVKHGLDYEIDCCGDGEEVDVESGVARRDERPSPKPLVRD